MIGIINYHLADNYGAVLQAYALQKIIQEIGYKSEIIDYHCPYIINHYKLLHFSSIQQLGSDIVYFLDHIHKKKGFQKFRNKYLVLSQKSYEPDNITNVNSLYRVFITGSDQVFNYTNTGFDKSYFLDFVSNQNFKCAYAASFGFSNIPENYRNSYKELLKDYKYISFREQSGSNLYYSLTSQYAKNLLDPTLVAEKDVWNFDNSDIRNRKPYILVYFLERSDKAFSFVKMLKQVTGLNVIYIGSLIKKHRNRLDAEFLGRCSPEEFVNLFRNAEYVVTNSFHGTAFSIIFEKQFWVNPLENGVATNDRFISLLEQLGLVNRFLPDLFSNDILNTKIDYAKVNEKLKIFRQNSINYIRDVCRLDEE